MIKSALEKCVVVSPASTKLVYYVPNPSYQIRNLDYHKKACTHEQLKPSYYYLREMFRIDNFKDQDDDFPKENLLSVYFKRVDTYGQILYST